MASDDLENNLYKNWVRGAKGLEYLQEGLRDFVGDNVKHCRDQSLQTIIQHLPTGSPLQCSQCTSQNLLPEHAKKTTACNNTTCLQKKKSGNCFGSKPKGRRKCPNGICSKFYDAIVLNHSYKDPLWKNTDPTTWCTDPLGWSFATCFQTTTSPGTSADTTDAAGLLSILINNLSVHTWLACNNMGSKTVCSFYKARYIRNDILHSPKLELEDSTLYEYLDTFKAVLQDSKCLATNTSSQNAVDKLSQLKSKQIHISQTDENNLIKLRKEALSELNERKIEALREIDGRAAAVSSALKEDIDVSANTALSDIENASKGALQDIDKKSKDLLSEIKEAILDVTEQLNKRQTEVAVQSGASLLTSVDNASSSAATPDRQERSGGLFGFFRKRQLRKNMKEDLIKFYRRYHCNIPVSPLVEEHAVPLTDFYVQPPLYSIDVQRKYGGHYRGPPKKTPYCDVFLHGDGELYKDVYITAKAGVGKTSFAKKVCMVWCQAQRPIETLERKFKPEDISSMKTFEFLFMVSLRDIDTSVCDLDDMVERSLLYSLARSSRYSRRHLEDILNERTCLVVLDGLDEWTHPLNCSRGCCDVHAIPHIHARDRCTVMTTTRPWKLDVVKLGSSQIDRHVEINELDKISSKELIENAVSVLNRQNSQDQSKTVEGFQRATSTLKLEHLQYIPYILLQMICLWFDGKSIGRTQCEIYTNIITLTLSRGLKKLEKKSSPPRRCRNIASKSEIPPCSQLNDLFKSNYDVLISLGKLAFEKLFSSKAEGRLVFDRSEVLSIISEDIIRFCLEIGLLSQTKDCRSVSERRSTLSFQHKSIQEYFAALYIQTCYDNQDIQESIRKECNKMSAVLEMANVFVFLAGLNSQACGKCFHIVKRSVYADEIIEVFRNSDTTCHMYIPRLCEYWNIMKSWQSMLTDSVQEILNSYGESNIPLYIEDIIIDSTVTLDTCAILKILSEGNNDKIRSISISQCRSTEEFTEKLQTVDLQDMHLLHRLLIEAVPEEQDLNRLMSGSVHTLTCLILNFSMFTDKKLYRQSTEISSETVGILLNMNSLQIIYLEDILLKHADIERLFQYLATRETMTLIRLFYVGCNDHNDQCNGFCLDLSQNKNLKNLDLDILPVSTLHVDSSSLERCAVGELQPAVQSSLVQCLSEEENLSTVSFSMDQPEQPDVIVDTLSKLSKLESVAIQGTDLGDAVLTLPPRMKYLELVLLYMVTLTGTSLRRLIDSVDVLPQQVTIKMESCTVIPEKDYRQVKKKIRSSPNYQVVFDGYNESGHDQFQFQKWDK